MKYRWFQICVGDFDFERNHSVDQIFDRNDIVKQHTSREDTHQQVALSSVQSLIALNPTKCPISTDCIITGLITRFCNIYHEGSSYIAKESLVERISEKIANQSSLHIRGGVNVR